MTEHVSTQAHVGDHNIVWDNSAYFATIRLKPGDDLQLSLLSFVQRHCFSAVSVVTCVGSLDTVCFRLASAGVNSTSEYFKTEGLRYEITSLVGTLEKEATKSEAYSHLHISIADIHGKVIGGHLMPGCKIYTTAEITLVVQPMLQFKREPCSLSGYDELVVSRASCGSN